MLWLIFIAHAFNPLILAIGIGLLRQEFQQNKTIQVSSVIGLVFGSLIIYLLWLATHFGIIFIQGKSSDFEELIGMGQSFHYFLPFLIGVVMIINELIIRPMIRQDKYLAANQGMVLLLICFGSYTMFINYIAWIAG